MIAGRYAVVALVFAAAPLYADEPPRPRWDCERVNAHGEPIPAGAKARFGIAVRTHRADPDFPHNGIAIALSASGRWLAAHLGGDLLAWDAATGELLWRAPVGLPEIVGLAFRGESTLHILTRDGTLRTRDTQTGRTRRVYQAAANGRDLALSADGRFVAVQEEVRAGTYQTAVVETDSGRERFAVATRSDSCASFSCDGRFLLVNSADDTYREFDTTTGEPVAEAPAADLSEYLLTAAPGGRLLAAFPRELGGAEPYALRLLGLRPLPGRGGTAVTKGRLFQSTYAPPAFSSDGKLMAVPHAYEGVSLVDLGTQKPAGRIASPWRLDGIVLSRDGSRLAALAPGAGVVVWDARGWRWLTPSHGPSRDETADMTALAFSPDAKRVASTQEYLGDLIVWDAATGAARNSFALERPLRSLAFSPDGNLLLGRSGCRLLQSPDWDGPAPILFYDSRTGVRRPGPLLGTIIDHSEDGRDVVWQWLPRPLFRADIPEEVAAEAWQFQVTLRDWLTGLTWAALRQVQPHLAQFRCTDADTRQFHFTTPGFASPDKRITAGIRPGDGLAKASLPALWEIRTGGKRAVLRLRYKDVYAFSPWFSPDGRLLACRQPDGLHLFDLDAGREAYRPIPALTGGLAFAPDGKTLATAGEGGTVVLWDLAYFRKPEPAPEPLTEAEFDQLWEALASRSALHAYRAMTRLRACPGQSVSWMRKHLVRYDLHPQACRWIDDLDSDDFRPRQEAYRSLELMGERGRPALEFANTGRPTLEQRRRIERLLDKLGPPFTSADGLRLYRAVEVLERIGTFPAAVLLRELAPDGATDPLAVEVRRALERLRARR